MKRDDNQLAAVVYADLFGYPLTIKEAKLWAIRKVREENSTIKLEQAKKITNWLKKIPTISGVFVTGSVATNNAKRGADIDLMIITLPGALWLTRLIVFLVLKLFGKLKKPYCPNIFLDLNHLEILDKNLFTAHEVLQARCLFDRGGVYRKWLEVNIWTREYLPNVYQNSKFEIRNSKQIQNSNSKNFKTVSDFVLRISSLIVIFLELIVFLLQYLYMKSKMTHESVGWGFAFFHPNNRGEKVLKKFEQNFLRAKRGVLYHIT